MAVITIRIEDDNEGGCLMTSRCDVDIPETDEECTPAMVTGATIMQLMEAIRNQALAEAAEEGKGE